eukprot:855914-Amphidinium_carterae.1
MQCQVRRQTICRIQKKHQSKYGRESVSCNLPACTAVLRNGDKGSLWTLCLGRPALTLQILLSGWDSSEASNFMSSACRAI